MGRGERKEKKGKVKMGKGQSCQIKMGSEPVNNATRCYYCNKELFPMKIKSKHLFTHLYCYWKDMAKDQHTFDDDSDDEFVYDDAFILKQEEQEEDYLFTIFNLPKGNLQKYKDSNEYCIFVK